MTETRKENGRIIQRYVDILTNGGFKALFGDAQNKDVVMWIINVLHPDHRQVVDIEYLPTENQGQLVDFSKEYQYDFMCRDVSGAVVDRRPFAAGGRRLADLEISQESSTSLETVLSEFRCGSNHCPVIFAGGGVSPR